MNVVVPPGAELQIRTINGWWRENREAAPDLFAEEVASALDLLARVPRFGQRCRHRTVSGLRRVIPLSHLLRTQHRRSADPRPGRLERSPRQETADPPAILIRPP
ncbi:MAG: hypothetical protein KF830_07835 [Planctomycetes bacterium]|nr:hypothetical protein [Planctomycetota bacterium]